MLMASSVAPWVTAMLAMLGNPITKTIDYRIERFSVAGQTVVLNSAYVITAECKSGTLPIFIVLASPKHGKLLTNTPAPIRYTSTDRSKDKCDGSTMQGTVVNYISDAKYVGTEIFSYLVVYSTGTARLFKVKMTVFSSSSEPNP